MREIKFRAWDKKAKKIYKVAHISNLLTAGEFITVRKNKAEAIIKIERELEEGSYDLMQYTGLKDKDNVDVYEGDIYQDNLTARYYEVVFEYGSYNLNMIGELDISVPFWFDVTVFNESPERLSKVGNIYENPELLPA